MHNFNIMICRGNSPPARNGFSAPPVHVYVELVAIEDRSFYTLIVRCVCMCVCACVCDRAIKETSHLKKEK